MQFPEDVSSFPIRSDILMALAHTKTRDNELVAVPHRVDPGTFVHSHLLHHPVPFLQESRK